MAVVRESFEVFYAYSHKDEKLRDELEKHLTHLKREGLISGWHDRRIDAGTEWAAQINEQMPSRILCKSVEQESMETRLGELMRMNGGETTRVRMKPAGL